MVPWSKPPPSAPLWSAGRGCPPGQGAGVVAEAEPPGMSWGGMGGKEWGRGDVGSL